MRMPAMNRVLAAATMIAALCVTGLIAAQSGANTVLKPADLEKLFPATAELGAWYILRIWRREGVGLRWGGRGPEDGSD